MNAYKVYVLGIRLLCLAGLCWLLWPNGRGDVVMAYGLGVLSMVASYLAEHGPKR